MAFLTLGKWCFPVLGYCQRSCLGSRPYCSLTPCPCPWLLLPPKIMKMLEVRTVTCGQVVAQGPRHLWNYSSLHSLDCLSGPWSSQSLSSGQGSCLGLWPLLQLGSVLISVAPTIPEGCAGAWNMDRNMRSCWYQRVMLPPEPCKWGGQCCPLSHGVTWAGLQTEAMKYVHGPISAGTVLMSVAPGTIGKQCKNPGSEPKPEFMLGSEGPVATVALQI